MKKIFLLLFVGYIMGIFLPGFKGDLLCWSQWSLWLQYSWNQNEINYPPLYLNYLWLIGHLPNYLLSVEPIWIFKYPIKMMSLLPVLMSHVWICFRVYNKEGFQTAWILAVCPIFWVVGPLWGQIDLILGVLLLEAMWAVQSSRYSLVGLYLGLALSFKFQMVFFGPILLIWMLYRKMNLSQWLKCTVVFGLIFTASFLIPIVSGNFSEVFERAYLQNLHIFPYTTLNASNFWMIVTSNLENANKICFGLTYQKWGYLLIGFAYLFFLNLFRFKFQEENIEIWMALSGFVFFFFAPNMHERYFVSAIPFLLIFLVRHRMWTSIISWSVLGVLILMVPLVQNMFPIHLLDIPLALGFLFLMLILIKNIIYLNRIKTTIEAVSIADQQER